MHTLGSPEEEAAAVAYPRMAEPWTLGGRHLSNRFVLAPMSVSYGDTDGHVTAATVGHYARRSAGGSSVVITENIAVSESGRQMPKQLLASDPRFLPGLADLAEAIKSRGAVAIAQIVHSGRYAGPWDEYHVRRRLAPSAIEFELRAGQYVTPSAMTAQEVEEAIAEFGAAADLVRRAGFDGVEIHGAAGFLVSSFQTPRMNQRTDAYGEDRNLFARKVIDAVAEAAGPDLIKGYHLMVDERMPGGWTTDDAAAFVSQLDPAKVDFLIPIPMTFESMRSKAGTSSMQHDPTIAARLAAVTKVAVIANGGLNTAAEAEAAMAAGGVQAVALGRALLCDPDLPTKALRDDSAATLTCACNPPRCLMTQLTGAVCDGWPKAVHDRGFWGIEDGEQDARELTATHGEYDL